MIRQTCLLVTALLALSVPGSGAWAEDYQLETWTDGLDLPWSIGFLPNGSTLVTELGGKLKRIGVDGSVEAEIENVPAVYFAGQGGLFDVLPDPAFARNQTVYLSFAEGTPEDNGTAVARARLVGDSLEDVEIIFRNFTRKDTAVHYGARMAFLEDGTLLLTTGDGFDYREAAQDIESGLGKVLRMNTDGSPAADNPFEESPYVYAYGVRNPQGLTVNRDGVIWLHDHGPAGGDEVNRIAAGNNYGWPAVTHGKDYSGGIITPYTEWHGVTPPLWHWVPSIAPSGLTYYEGDAFPDWHGYLLLGALVEKEVRMMVIENGQMIMDTPMFSELDARIRDVRSGPGGALFVLTPDAVIRVTPAD